MKKSILAVGTNPALQKVLIFDTFTPCSINRAQKALTFASGKGINLARAVRSLGLCDATVMQFSGGESGQLLNTDLTNENINCLNVPIKSSTRECTTCLDKSGNMTELIEPAPTTTEIEVANFINLFRSQAGNFDAVGLSGTLPNGSATTARLYLKLVAELPLDLPLLFDSCCIFGEEFSGRKNFCLKLNQDELYALTSLADVRQGIRFLANHIAGATIGITAGPNDAFLYCKNHFWRFEIPHLDTILNPVGSGDSASGAYLSAILQGSDEVEAFNLALGCACANTQSLKCGEFSASLANQISNSIKIIKE